MSSGDDWFPLVELTHRLGGLIWVEQSLAALCAAWAETEADDVARISLFEAGRHHMWHAETLAGLFVTSPSLDAQAAVRAPTSGWQDAVDVLGEVEETETRLLVIVRPLHEWLRRESAALVDLAVATSDRPVTRLLNFCDLDHERDTAALTERFDDLTNGVTPLDAARVAASLSLVRD